MALSNWEKGEYRERFVETAGGATSSLPMTAVIALLRAMGWADKRYSDQTLQGWFKPGPDNILGVDGFIAGVDRNTDSKQMLRARAVRSFYTSDTDMNKRLSKDELKAFFEKDGEKTHDDVMNMVMDYCDVDKSGDISLQEFFKCLGVKD